MKPSILLVRMMEPLNKILLPIHKNIKSFIYKVYKQ